MKLQTSSREIPLFSLRCGAIIYMTSSVYQRALYEGSWKSIDETCRTQRVTLVQFELHLLRIGNSDIQTINYRYTIYARASKYSIITECF